MIKKYQQDKRENEHADDLSPNTNVVDDGHQSYARNINDRADDNRDQCDEDSTVHAKDGRWNARENGKYKNRNGKCHCCDGKHACKEVNPPCKPSQGEARQAFAPLVNRACYREVRCEFSEVERY